MSVDMCADMRAGTCSGMRADMCVGICVDVHGHVYRHAHRRAYRHGVTAAAGVQYRDIYSHTMSFRRAGSFFFTALYKRWRLRLFKAIRQCHPNTSVESSSYKTCRGSERTGKACSKTISPRSHVSYLQNRGLKILTGPGHRVHDGHRGHRGHGSQDTCGRSWS